MNELLDAVVDPDGVVLPLVPVGILLAPFSKQPVRVILSFELALLLLLLVWSLVALCAAPMVTAETHAIAIAALIRFIQPPVCNSHREACKRFARYFDCFSIPNTRICRADGRNSQYARRPIF